MLLGIDIGNTTIYFGIIENGQIENSFRIVTDKNRTTDEYTVIIKRVLEENINIEKITDIIMASVVPEITDEVERALSNITGKKVILLKRDIKNALNMTEDCIRVLGADLIADSVGAISKYKAPIIVFDMGTATTCSVINKEGIFMGGIICPGLKTSVDALISKASQLSSFSLGNPRKVVSLDTAECINSGAIYGHSSMINGLRKKVEEETEEKYTVVLTGGNSEYVENYIDKDIIVDRNLIFYGLDMLYRNKFKID